MPINVIAICWFFGFEEIEVGYALLVVENKIPIWKCKVENEN